MVGSMATTKEEPAGHAAEASLLATLHVGLAPGAGLHAATAPAPRRAAAAPPPAGVTLDQLLGVMTACPRDRGRRHLDLMNRAMAEFHIDNRLRRCAFLAQIGEESGELRYMEEIASGEEYDITVDPRKARGLGNLKPGDGRRYKGRGPIQLTGRSNYRATGKALGLDLENHPELAAQPAIAWRTSCYFWESNGLNQLADEGKFRALTYVINKAYRHYDVRLAYYERALHVIQH
jgi:putative chitinase